MPKLLDIEGVAKRFKVTQRFIAKLVGAGLMPQPVETNPLRWDAEQLERWYEAGCKPVEQSKE